METIRVSINGKEINCSEGESILWVALDNGIYIPNLCAIRKKKEPYGACRLCFVEVEGENNPITACSLRAREGMFVNTLGANAIRLARTAFELILSIHPVDCAHCLKSGSCELQKIAKHLGVRLNSERFRKLIRNLTLDNASPVFMHDPQKCVLCGRCVWFCQEELGLGGIGFAHRGLQRSVTTFGDEPIGESECKNLIELVDICPTGAFVHKKSNKIKTT
jgi:formate dehydrogenase major subunit/NADH-quinone oxidoreductase subunit G